MTVMAWPDYDFQVVEKSKIKNLLIQLDKFSLLFEDLLRVLICSLFLGVS